MPRDYKHTTSRKHRPPRSPVPAILPFLSGLCLGLLVAFFIYLNDLHPPKQAGEERSAAQKTPTSGSDQTTQARKPRFDFYTILPEREVKVPVWEFSEKEQQAPAPLKASYILQVGSFQRYEEADKAKARLALAGIQANIQRVVINGQDVWYRVRVGPLKTTRALNQTRRRLVENNMDFMLLKIRE